MQILRKMALTGSALAAGILLAAAASCTGIAGLVTAQHRDWRFVQSVGGIGVDSPRIEGGKGGVLPVACDVSGLREFTVKPTTLNSGLVTRRVACRVDKAEGRGQNNNTPAPLPVYFGPRDSEKNKAEFACRRARGGVLPLPDGGPVQGRLHALAHLVPHPRQGFAGSRPT